MRECENCGYEAELTKLDAADQMPNFVETFEGRAVMLCEECLLSGRAYTWEFTVKLKVAAMWVVDGFDLSKEKHLESILEDMASSQFGYAYSSEVDITANITKAPKHADIRHEQGYRAPKKKKVST